MVHPTTLLGKDKVYYKSRYMHGTGVQETGILSDTLVESAVDMYKHTKLI
jgi:hypothetical protein